MFLLVWLVGWKELFWLGFDEMFDLNICFVVVWFVVFELYIKWIKSIVKRVVRMLIMKRILLLIFLIIGGVISMVF